MLIRNKPGVVVPDCCEAVQKTLAIVLVYDSNDLSGMPAILRDAPPGLDWAGTPDNNFVSSMQRWLDEQPEETKRATRFETAKPRWVVGSAVESSMIAMLLIHQEGGWFNSRLYPTFCPYCGTKLPDIERRPAEDLPGPVHVPQADGDYCATCEERSGACECWWPSVAWRTVGEPNRVTHRLDPHGNGQTGRVLCGKVCGRLPDHEGWATLPNLVDCPTCETLQLDLDI